MKSKLFLAIGISIVFLIGFTAAVKPAERGTSPQPSKQKELVYLTE